MHAGTVRLLREAGWDVHSVIDDLPSESDYDVLARAVELDAVLVTNDRDFGELIFHRGRRPPGCLLYIRIRDLSPEIVATRLLAALDDPKVRGQMVVIERDGVRFRAFPATGENDG